MTTSWSHKITSQHLDRKAVVYLRQSSSRQVAKNKESQRRQYALADRARELGWRDVEVIDADLGSSASIGAKVRVGFEHLLAMVALGEVGVVFHGEVSRLSRTDKDWCHLQEVCQVFGTLLGDEQHIYDLNQQDDQMVLGFKGTISVVESRMIQMRLLEGMRNKASRGELIRALTPGYVQDKSDRVIKDPNKRVQEAIALVFDKFRELRSARQTFKWFHDERIMLPVNKPRGGTKEIVFQLPTYGFVKEVIRNPFYAGAYFDGRRKTELVLVDGRPTKRSRFVKLEEMRVFLKDHHEAYISWTTYEENQRVLRENRNNFGGDESVGAVRSGQGILAGLLRCGRCGRKLHVRYWGKSGTAARYLCSGDFQSGGSYCLGFGGSTVDRRFAEELLQTISPFGVQASIETIDRGASTDDAQRSLLTRQLEEAEYQAKRAFEQYNEVDPRNRLVASDLERRWNEKLEEVDRTRSELASSAHDQPSLSEQDRRKIMALGENFADVWHSDACLPELKKKILRTVVEEIVVNLEEPSTLHFVVHWKGGTHTKFEMEKPRSGVGRKTSMEDVELIRKMAVRYGDDDIARVLNKLGRRTGQQKRWNQHRVATARRTHSIPGQRHTRPDPDILSLNAAVRHCRVSDTTITRLVKSNLLPMHQVAPWAPWEIKRSDLESEPVKSILANLRETGKLVLKGVSSNVQPSLFE